ncbi:MAG: hypothetical protein PHF50_01700 [Patescibacteria group bacterium]|nr:hypothetical protein [Patescibacteria group bacterium]
MKNLKFEFKAILVLIGLSLALFAYYNNGFFIFFGVLYSIVIYLVFFFYRKKYKYLDTKDIEIKREIIKLIIKVAVVSVISSLLSLYTYNFFKEIYILIVNPQFGDPGLFLGFRELGLIILGFLMAYSFYASFLFFISTDLREWRFFLIVILPVIIFCINSWSLIPSVFFLSALGFGIAWVINLIIKKIKL